MKIQQIFPIVLAIMLPAVFGISLDWGIFCVGNKTGFFHQAAFAENESTVSGYGNAFSAKDTLKSALEKNRDPLAETMGPARQKMEPDVSKIPFRRVYVPETLLPSVPVQGGGFWPVPSREFERWAEQRDAEDVDETETRERVLTLRARYEAEFSDPLFLTGKANFLLQKAPSGSSLRGVGSADLAVSREHFWKTPSVRFAIQGGLLVEETELNRGDMPASLDGAAVEERTDGAMEVLRNPGGDQVDPAELSGADVLQSRQNTGMENGAGTRNEAVSPMGMHRGRRHFQFQENGEGEVEFSSQDFDADGFCRTGFLWSQKGVSAPGGDLVFDLKWIPSADTRWILKLPPQWIPETSDGIVMLRSPEINAVSETDPFQERNADAGLESGWRVWELSFGGRSSARLVLCQANGNLVQTPTPLSADQKNIYQISKNGLDVFVRMNLNVLQEDEKKASPIRELGVWIDEGLAPVSVRFNEEEVAWSAFSRDISKVPAEDGAEKAAGAPSGKTGVLETLSGTGKSGVSEIDGVRSVFQSETVHKTDRENGRTYLAITLPKELNGHENRLEINAIGNADRWLKHGGPVLHDLPEIRLQNVLRTESRTRIQIFSPLELVDFSLENASLLSHQENSALAMESLEILEHADDVSVKMALAPRSFQLDVDTTTAVDFQENGLAAVMEVLASVKGGEYFEIWGVVDRAWTIDSVESDWVGLIEDWNLEVDPGNVHQALSDLDPMGGLPEKLNAAGWDLDSLGILKIQLAHSVSPGKPVSLRVRARRLGYSDDLTFSGVQLAPLYLPTCRIGQSWILCGSSNMWKVKFLEPYRNQEIYWEDLAETSGTGRSDGTRSQTGMIGPGSVFEMLERTRTHFPDHTVFLTGIQDFRTVPMLRLEQSPQHFTAAIHGFYDIAFDSSAIFRISCDPKGTEVDRIQIMIRPGTLLGTSWKFPRQLYGSKAECIRRQPVESPQDLNASFELWEIRFPQPQRDAFDFEVALLTTSAFESDETGRNDLEETNGKFHLRASESALLNSYVSMTQDEQRAWWRTHFPEGLDLPLIDVLNASECSGLVTLKNDITDRIYVETREMVPTLLSVSELSGLLHENSPEDCVQFRFDPHAISNSPAPLLKLNWKNQSVALPSAWVWENVCGTQIFENGKKAHSLTFRIENVNRDRMMLRIRRSVSEDTSELLAVWVNGQRLPVDSVLLSSGQCEKRSGQKSENGKDRGIRPGNLQEESRKKDPVEGTSVEVDGHSDVKGELEEDPLDGIPAEEPVSSEEQEKGWTVLSIPFPGWKRENQITVQWLESEETSGIFQRLEPPEFSIDLPVLRKNWKVWFPENFVLSNEFTDLKWTVPSSIQRTDGSIGRIRDTLLMRLLGNLRIGQSFLTSRENVYPENTLERNAENAVLGERNDGTSAAGASGEHPDQILQLSTLATTGYGDTARDENCCFLGDFRPVWILHGNLLEACRGFLLILVCLVTVRFFASRRVQRIFLCGIFAGLTMIVPLVWTPIFSGIFWGLLASFAVSSAKRHLDHLAKHGKPVIEVRPASGTGILSAVVRESLGGKLFRRRGSANVENGSSGKLSSSGGGGAPSQIGNPKIEMSTPETSLEMEEAFLEANAAKSDSPKGDPSRGRPGMQSTAQMNGDGISKAKDSGTER